MTHRKKNGFTLVELLVGMALTSIVSIMIVTAYQSQVRGKNTQEALTEMIQRSRFALELMTNEIRMAGLDPLESRNPRIILANPNELIFSLDSGNGASNQPDGDSCDTNEAVRYKLTLDTNNDGRNDTIASGTECNLGRETGSGLVVAPVPSCPSPNGTSGLQPLARNVDALNFIYLNNLGQQITPTTQLLRDSIRSIQVTIVARSGKDTGFLNSYTNNDVYRNQLGNPVLPAQGDAFRRQVLSSTIKLRN